MFRLWKNNNKQSQQDTVTSIDLNNVPRHVAVIMDGNGRWAKKRALPRVAGHHAGMKTVKKITIAANDLGVEILTMYAFSTENWTRPQDEVDYLMRLPQEFLQLELQELIDQNVRVRMTGWHDGLPNHTLQALAEAEAKTANNTGLILNFALNYGSRKEIVDAAKQLAQDAVAGKITLDEITEERLASKMLTNDLPDPDLLIRTSGELRLSNFMLWQLAYTEFWFSPQLWPDFSEQHFYEAIREYQHRIRRYGGLI